MDVPEFFGEESESGRQPEGGPASPIAPSGANVIVSPPKEIRRARGYGGEFGGGGASGTFQVRTKPGVRLPQRPEMIEALRIAQARGDVITSGNDSSHLPNSLHWDDLAIDVRPAPDFKAQAARYRAAGYTVLEEGLPGGVQITPGVGTGKHLHVSFDPEGKRV